MILRLKELEARRAYLLAASQADRDTATRSLRAITDVLSKDRLSHLLKSSAAGFAGIMVLRWVGQKLAGGIKKAFRSKLARFASRLRWR